MNQIFNNPMQRAATKMNSLNNEIGLSPYEIWHLEKYGYVPRDGTGLYDGEDPTPNISSAEEAFIFNIENP